MKKWILNTAQPHYFDIEIGRKTVEGRVPDPSKEDKNYLLIQPEDILVVKEVDENYKPTNLAALEMIVTNVDVLISAADGFNRTLPCCQGHNSRRTLLSFTTVSLATRQGW